VHFWRNLRADGPSRGASCLVASTRLVACTRTFPPMLTRFVRFVLRHILEASGQEAGIEVTLTASTLVVTNFEVCARRARMARASQNVLSRLRACRADLRASGGTVASTVWMGPGRAGMQHHYVCTFVERVLNHLPPGMC